MSEPLVSVLMAARNHEQFAADAAASILDQDYERLELIAIDDASDDATADVLEQCRRRGPARPDALPPARAALRESRRPARTRSSWRAAS